MWEVCWVDHHGGMEGVDAGGTEVLSAWGTPVGEEADWPGKFPEEDAPHAGCGPLVHWASLVSSYACSGCCACKGPGGL